MYGSAFVLLVILAALGLLAHWAAAKLRDPRHRLRLLGVAWAVIAVAAVVALQSAFPPGHEAPDPRIHPCESAAYPDCPD